MIRCTIFLASVVWAAVQAPAQDAKPLRVYFVGNSVTDTINYRGLAELAKSHGRQQIWGRHMIPGAPLQWIWEHPKDYFERLTLELRKTCPDLKKPVLMVPVGHVMFELNQRMKAGEVPGHKQIQDVFADGIHLNHVGSYVVGCTYFAMLYRENPKGLPAEPYKVTDPKLAEVIQDTAWKVVSTHELAGVAKARTDKDENTAITVDVVLERVELPDSWYNSGRDSGNLSAQGAG